MKIVIINQQYPPETAATGQVFGVVATGLAERGAEVTVVCGTPFYSKHEKLPREETREGVKIVRLWNTAYPKSSFFGKIINQATFMLSLLEYVLFRIPNDARVLVTTAPPLGLCVAALGRVDTKYKLYASIQDLYPDVLQAAGKMGSANLFYKILHNMMQWALNKCAKVITISQDMSSRLRLVYGATSVHVIPNPSTGGVVPLPHGAERMRRGLDTWEGKLVVQYSGNFGLAHEYETLLDTMRILRDDERVLFHITGGGENYKKLRTEAETLPNVVFEGYAPLETLSEHLSLADVALVIFDAAFRDVLLPSKYVGILASGRAVLLISGAESDISRDIAKHEAGEVFAHGASNELAAQLVRMSSHMAQARRMGRNARELYEEKYSGERIVEEYYKALTQ
ncbi:MAG: glycosyltransferase family 4 protein [Oscillospiraceae bacterium]|jgi:glycosyltransferase involved in cell wall biosynthesis|nr:glycosyltransferase family 4 protein [Oscillospiraceae bacterium]